MRAEAEADEYEAEAEAGMSSSGFTGNAIKSHSLPPPTDSSSEPDTPQSLTLDEADRKRMMFAATGRAGRFMSLAENSKAAGRRCVG